MAQERNPPRISVLMPVFNAGRYLDASIRSIVSQTYQNWEMLVVDDGSSDGSPEVVAKWSKSDPRIRFVANSINKGQTPCLNQGLQLARGEWVARQDADDLSHPLRFAAQLEGVRSDPKAVLIGCCGRIIDASDRMTGLIDVPLTPQEIAWTSPFLNPFIHTGVLFRTAVVRDQIGGYDEAFRIAQDYDLWTRIAAVHPTRNLPDRLVCYRHLDSSLSKAGKSVAFEEAARVSEREAEREFGRPLSAREARLLRSFREGLKPSERRDFWKLYDQLRSTRSGCLESIAARHRLKSAGAMASAHPVCALLDLLHAFRLDSRGTLGWLGERVKR